MKRLLVATAAAALCAVGMAWAQSVTDSSSTISTSVISNSSDRWIAPASPTGHLVGAAGVRRLTDIQVYNIDSGGAAWLTIYDVASAPTCSSTSGIVATILIPVASTPANGAGNNPLFGFAGKGFSNGIGYCVHRNMTDGDTTSVGGNSIVINSDYR